MTRNAPEFMQLPTFEIGTFEEFRNVSERYGDNWIPLSPPSFAPTFGVELWSKITGSLYQKSILDCGEAPFIALDALTKGVGAVICRNFDFSEYPQFSQRILDAPPNL